MNHTPSPSSLHTSVETSVPAMQAEDTSASSTPPSPTRGKDNTPTHPRLRQVFLQAKSEATNDFDQEQARKEAAGPVKTLSKRQRSNIRSAVICRSARNLYATYLEREIIEEEQRQLKITEMLFQKTEQNCLLHERIRQLQHKLQMLSGGQSWLPPDNNDQHDFFRGEQQQQHNVEVVEQQQQQYAADLDLALEGSFEEHQQNVIDQDVDFHNTHRTTTDEGNLGDQSELQDQLMVEKDELHRQYSSPVAVFEMPLEVPQATFLAPSLYEAVSVV